MRNYCNIKISSSPLARMPVRREPDVDVPARNRPAYILHNPRAVARYRKLRAKWIYLWIRRHRPVTCHRAACGDAHLLAAAFH